MEKSDNIEKRERKRDYNIETSPIQDNKFILTNIHRGLYTKFLLRLKEVEDKIPEASRKDYLPYSNVFEKVCKGFSIPKKEAMEVLFLLNDIGLIEFVKFKGIRLNYDVEKEV